METDQSSQRQFGLGSLLLLTAWISIVLGTIRLGWPEFEVLLDYAVLFAVVGTGTLMTAWGRKCACNLWDAVLPPPPSSDADVGHSFKFPTFLEKPPPTTLKISAPSTDK
jgi:hypothetical protein